MSNQPGHRHTTSSIKALSGLRRALSLTLAIAVGASCLPVFPQNVFATPTVTADLSKLDLAALDVPEEWGQVVETWRPADRPPAGLVIHLQDLHVHPEAQANLSELIGEFHGQLGIRLVGVEGATGVCETGLYASLPDPPSTERIARLFRQEGLFTGAEYYAITHPEAVTLWGVEDEATYLAHLSTYQDGANSRAEAEATIGKLRDALRRLRNSLYPKALLRLSALRDASERDEPDAFEAYLKELVRLGRSIRNLKPASGEGWDEVGVAKAVAGTVSLTRSVKDERRPEREGAEPRWGAATVRPNPHPDLSWRDGNGQDGTTRGRLRDYPHIRAALRAYELHPRLDMRQVERERGQLLDALWPLVTAEDHQRLTTLADRASTSSTSARRYHAALLQLARAHGLLADRSAYRAFRHYLYYTRLTQQLRSPSLTDELDQLEQAAEAALLKTDEQRTLARLLRQVELLDRLIHNRLSPRDLAAYQAMRRNLTPDALWRDLSAVHSPPRPAHQIASRGGQSIVHRQELVGLLANLSESERFYELAIKRDEALVENLARKMRDDGTHAALLVAGGFHTPGLTARLKARSLAYAVITPKVDGKLDETFYDERLRNVLPSVDELAQKFDRFALVPALATGSGTTPTTEFRVGRPSGAPDQPDQAQQFSKRDATFLSFLTLKARELAKRGREGIESMRAWMNAHPAQTSLYSLAIIWESGKVILSAMGLDIPFDDHGTLLAMAGSVSWRQRRSDADGPDPATVRANQTAFEYEDASQEFHGVDLEHFVHAQHRLADRQLSSETLRRLLRALGLEPSMSGQTAYEAIYKRLAEGHYSKKLIDLINGDTFTDPRLAIEIIGQNPNPKAQGVYEAVANSLDALGLHIGQFGKGVKQIVDWLQAIGEDRLDVFTKEDGAPYQLTILKSSKGQLFIQLKAISQRAFERETDLDTRGTAVRVTSQAAIPRTDADRDATRRNSQAGLAEGIHRRFAFVTSVGLTTQQRRQAPQRVNGFVEKQVLVPADTPPYTPANAQGRDIRVTFDDHAITITDNGIGMGADTVSRMFVPKRGSKHPEPLFGEAAQRELAKVEVVHDRTLPHRVSFARNGEVAAALDVPSEIHPEATMPGGLMVELGGLLDVPESRDRVIIPLDLKPGDVSNFQRGIEHAITQLIRHPSLTAVEKVRAINTIVVGLEGLVQGNPDYDHAIRTIRGRIQQAMTSTLDELQAQGYVLLPHGQAFAKLAIPQGKRPLFLNEYLFRWQGAASLKALGGEVVPGVTLGGEQRLPLVVVPFTEQSLERVRQFHSEWRTWTADERLPLIKTDRFIAIPTQLGARFLELATKRQRQPLNQDEALEFTSLAQRINILTASQVTTSYEVTEVPEQMALVPIGQWQVTPGAIDAAAITAFRAFLANPPLVPPGQRQPGQAALPPPDANQRLVLLENGDLVEIGTGRKVIGGVRRIETLGYGYYKLAMLGPRLELEVESPSGPGESLGTLEIFEPSKIVRWSGTSLETVLEGTTLDLMVSPDKRWVVDQENWVAVNLETSTKHYLSNAMQTTPPTSPSSTNVHNIQFSRNGRWLTYLTTRAKPGDKQVTHLNVVPLDQPSEVSDVVVDERPPGATPAVEHAVNPFAEVAFVQFPTGLLGLFDLNRDAWITTVAQHLRTDPTGTYTAIVDQHGKMSIYLHKAYKLLTSHDVHGFEIDAVRTRWDTNGRARFSIDVLVPAREHDLVYYEFTEQGAIRLGDRTLVETTAYFEAFYQEGKLEGERLTFRDLDPLQRLDHATAYRHPDFPLLIDNSDPAHPKAIDPITELSVSYAPGEIIRYDPTSQRLFVATQRGLVEYGVGMPPFPPISGWVTDGKPAHHLVYSHEQGWVFRDLGALVLTSYGSGYRSASFDGKYFVFTNPTTGDVVYLNPVQPEQPIFVPLKPQGPAWLDTAPSDAPSPFVIGQSPQRAFVWDALGGVAQEFYDRVERVNATTFIGYRGDSFVIFRMTSGSAASTVFASSSGETIVARTDTLLVIHNRITTHAHVLKVTTKTNTPPAKSVHLSASGRFSVHKLENGDLVYYDHDARNPSPNPLAMGGEYTEYLVHNRADVVITKDSRGDYGLFRLQTGTFSYVTAKHVEIDSSGMMAIVLLSGELRLVNPRTGGEVLAPSGYQTVKVSADDERMYAIVKEVDASSEWIIELSKQDGVRMGVIALSDYVFARGGTAQSDLPRFWEAYDLEKKTIWDRETNAKAAGFQREPRPWYGESLYRENPPTAPHEVSRLFGSTVTLTLDAHRLDWEANPYLFELNTQKAWGWGVRPSRETRRLDSLRGDQVFFATVKEGSKSWCVIRPVNLKPPVPTSFESPFPPFDRGLVNQSKTFILAQHGPTTYLVSADGTVTELTSQIPEGFVSTDVNGEYFVFSHPATGAIAYLDPRAVGPGLSAQPVQVDARVQQALERWKGDVVPRGEAWVQQVQHGYRPVLDLVPEEFRGEVEQRLAPHVRALYDAHQQELLERVRSAVERGQLIDLTNLRFDRFAARLQRMTQALPAYLAAIEPQLSQARHEARRAFYTDLFVGVMELSVNLELLLPAIDDRLFGAVAHGWAIRTQEHLDAVSGVHSLITELQWATHHQIGLDELRRMIGFLSQTVQADPRRTTEIVARQVNKLLTAKPETRHTYLTRWRQDFKDVDPRALAEFLKQPDRTAALGAARELAVFLTQDVELVKDRDVRTIPAGEDIPLPSGGIRLSQIMELELARPKSGPEDLVMGVDYLLARLSELPEASPELEAELLRNVTVQRESGAYTAEITQNSRDALRGRHGTLTVDFYTQPGLARGREYVEEARDDGPGASQEVALLIPKSTKAQGEQRDLTGFFGTGKYTIFEGVDRVEVLTKNAERAWLFTFTVEKANGTPTAIKLTGIRRITDPTVPQGVAIRRIKLKDNTIPELDQMLAQRAWKTFAGLSQHHSEPESFHITFIDHTGAPQPLQVQADVLSQTIFIATPPGETQPVPFGAMRLLGTTDFPLQVVDGAGLRVGELKKEFLALVPEPLQRHLNEWGVVIQIPLPLIRGRSAFEHEAEYLPTIQKYVAIECYKAIARQTLVQHTPQFIFEGFPLDWETNDDYWRAIDWQDAELVQLAERINRGESDVVTPQHLERLLPQPGRTDLVKPFVKFLLLLQVDTPSGRMSLLERRLAIQRALDEERIQRELGRLRLAIAQLELLKQLGLTVGEIPDVTRIPHHQARLAQGRNIETAHEQMQHAEDYVVDPSQYTDEERVLVRLADSAARLVGLEQVLLVSDEVSFAGAFRNNFQRKFTMFLNRSLVAGLGQPDPRLAMLDQATDTVDHELAHLLEQLMRVSLARVRTEGYVSHAAYFTHDAVGTFAEAMRYIASLWLANHSREPGVPGEPNPRPGAAPMGGGVTPAQLRRLAAEVNANTRPLQDLIEYFARSGLVEQWPFCWNALDPARRAAFRAQLANRGINVNGLPTDSSHPVPESRAEAGTLPAEAGGGPPVGRGRGRDEGRREGAAPLSGERGGAGGIVPTQRTPPPARRASTPSAKATSYPSHSPSFGYITKASSAVAAATAQRPIFHWLVTWAKKLLAYAAAISTFKISKSVLDTIRRRASDQRGVALISLSIASLPRLVNATLRALGLPTFDEDGLTSSYHTLLAVGAIGPPGGEQKKDDDKQGQAAGAEPPASAPAVSQQPVPAEPGTASTLISYPQGQAQETIRRTVERMDAEFGHWDATRAAELVNNEISKLSRAIRARTTLLDEHFSEARVEDWLDQFEREMLWELIRRFENQDRRILKIHREVEKLEKSDAWIAESDDFTNKRKAYMQGRSGPDAFETWELVAYFLRSYVEAAVVQQLLIELSRLPKVSQRIYRDCERADEVIARIAQWDFFHRFKNSNEQFPETILLLRGADYGNYHPGQRLNFPIDTYFTYLPAHAESFAGSEGAAIIAGEIPWSSIRHTGWTFLTRESYEPEFKVRGEVTVKAVFVPADQNDLAQRREFYASYDIGANAFVASLPTAEIDRTWNKADSPPIESAPGSHGVLNIPGHGPGAAPMGGGVTPAQLRRLAAEVNANTRPLQDLIEYFARSGLVEQWPFCWNALDPARRAAFRAQLANRGVDVTALPEDSSLTVPESRVDERQGPAAGSAPPAPRPSPPGEGAPSPVEGTPAAAPEEFTQTAQAFLETLTRPPTMDETAYRRLAEVPSLRWMTLGPGTPSDAPLPSTPSHWPTREGWTLAEVPEGWAAVKESFSDRDGLAAFGCSACLALGGYSQTPAGLRGIVGHVSSHQLVGDYGGVFDPLIPPLTVNASGPGHLVVLALHGAHWPLQAEVERLRQRYPTIDIQVVPFDEFALGRLGGLLMTSQGIGLYEYDADGTSPRLITFLPLSLMSSPGSPSPNQTGGGAAPKPAGASETDRTATTDQSAAPTAEPVTVTSSFAQQLARLRVDVQRGVVTPRPIQHALIVTDHPNRGSLLQTGLVELEVSGTTVDVAPFEEGLQRLTVDPQVSPPVDLLMLDAPTALHAFAAVRMIEHLRSEETQRGAAPAFVLLASSALSEALARQPFSNAPAIDPTTLGPYTFSVPDIGGSSGPVISALEQFVQILQTAAQQLPSQPDPHVAAPAGVAPMTDASNGTAPAGGAAEERAPTPIAPLALAADSLPSNASAAPGWPITPLPIAWAEPLSQATQVGTTDLNHHPVHQLPDGRRVVAKRMRTIPHALGARAVYVTACRLGYQGINAVQLIPQRGNANTVESYFGEAMGRALTAAEQAAFDDALEEPGPRQQGAARYREVARRFGASFVQADLYRVFAGTGDSRFLEQWRIRQAPGRPADIRWIDYDAAFSTEPGSYPAHLSNLPAYLEARRDDLLSSSRPLVAAIAGLSDGDIAAIAEEVYGEKMRAFFAPHDALDAGALPDWKASFIENARQRRDIFRAFYAGSANSAAAPTPNVAAPVGEAPMGGGVTPAQLRTWAEEVNRGTRTVESIVRYLRESGLVAQWPFLWNGLNAEHRLAFRAQLAERGLDATALPVVPDENVITVRNVFDVLLRFFAQGFGDDYDEYERRTLDERMSVYVFRSEYDGDPVRYRTDGRDIMQMEGDPYSTDDSLSGLDRIEVRLVEEIPGGQFDIDVLGTQFQNAFPDYAIDWAYLRRQSSLEYRIYEIRIDLKRKPEPYW